MNVAQEVGKGIWELDGMVHSNIREFLPAVTLEKGLRILEDLPNSKFRGELFLTRRGSYRSAEWTYGCNAVPEKTCTNSMMEHEGHSSDQLNLRFITFKLVRFAEAALANGLITHESLLSPEGAPFRDMVKEALKANIFLGNERLTIVQMVRAEMQKEAQAGMASLPSKPIISTPEDGAHMLRGMLLKLGQAVGYQHNA